MNRLLTVRTVALSLLFLRLLDPAQAQDSKPSGPSGSVAAIQAQLDALKEGQQRLFKELEEIKQLLQQRAPRSDFSTKPTGPSVTSLNVHGEPFRGTNTARIAVVEYSDFECSFCAKYARDVFPRLDQEYVQTGKVRYFFRDLPEPEHTNAWLKARAARCAGDQGKFWEMHDRLFAAPSATEQDLSALASSIGLDAQGFSACLESGKYLVNIQRSADGAKRMGILGTPALLIGTLSVDGDFVRVAKVLLGADAYDPIKAALDELAAAAAKN